LVKKEQLFKNRANDLRLTGKPYIWKVGGGKYIMAEGVGGVKNRRTFVGTITEFPKVLGPPHLGVCNGIMGTSLGGQRRGQWWNRNIKKLVRGGR